MNGIRTFKNPLGMVSFTQPRTVTMVKDYFKQGQQPWDIVDYKVRVGWQQPIIAKSKSRPAGLQMNDLLVDAILPDEHKPILTFETPRFNIGGDE